MIESGNANPIKKCPHSTKILELSKTWKYVCRKC